MARPCKDRIISKNLKVCCFAPLWIPKECLDKVDLKMEELQAIKFANLDLLSNKAWAEKMWISAPTFNRILKSANKKLADAIINSKAIKVCS
jgi:predicted DNA-binding protein (UPF0251 family)